MAVAAHKIETNSRDEKWSEDEARDWLHHQAEISVSGSFTVTQRQLATKWGWSVASVRNLINSMEMAGILRREVLPNNGGTRITLAERYMAPVVVPLKREKRQAANAPAAFSFGDIEHIQHSPSQSLTDKLAMAYQGIIYGKPGFEHCDIEHLELIEQALFPDMYPSFQQAA